MLINMRGQNGSKVASWSSGTDAEIVDALRRHYANEINLRDYWKIGDARNISVPATSGVHSGTQEAQTNTWYILDNRDIKTLVYPAQAGNHTTGAFVVGMKNALANREIISWNTSTEAWSGADLHTWLNRTWYDAIPVGIRGIFKKHYNFSATYKGGDDWSGDYFAVPAVKEVLGVNTKCFSNEDANLTQFLYYKNVTKPSPGDKMWTRSRTSSGSYNALYLTIKSSMDSVVAEGCNSNYKIVLFGVI